MEKKKLQPKVALMKAKMKNSNDVIQIQGDIGEDWYGSGITNKKIIEALATVTTDEVDVHINSYGGDAFEGVAIFNTLKQSDKTINVYVDGIAASSASLIAMAGDKIYMPKNTTLMVHNAWTYTWGNQNDLRKAADDLEKLSSSYCETYLGHFKGSKEEMQALMDEESELTAQECIDLGLADEIIEYNESDEDDQDVEASMNFKEKLLAKYKTKQDKKADEKVSSILDRFSKNMEEKI